MRTTYLRFSPKTTIIIASLSLVLIGYIDVRTGDELSLSAFYLLPVSLVALNLGRTMGIWSAVISAVLETAVHIWGGFYYSSTLIYFWNTGILLTIYTIFAIMTSSLRSAYEKEKERAVELELVNEKLKDSYREMESFSYSVSHDLRAPLRIIDGLSDAVLKDYSDKLDNEGRDILRSIQGNTKRMDQLILALLNLSKVGRQEIKIVEINMEKAAALVADDLKTMAAGRTANVTIKKLPVAHGDVTLIRQVLTNLLSNAFKFTRDRDIALVEVGGWRSDGEDLFYVKDNGVGFDMKSADRLFGVFQRLHTLKEFEGTGIGLSIVERIITRHGGRVWAEGKKNEGATFYFALPRKKD